MAHQPSRDDSAPGLNDPVKAGQVTVSADDSIKERVEERGSPRTDDILNSILSASPIGIGMIENDRIRWVNEEMARIFGFEEEADYAGRAHEILYASRDEYDNVMEKIAARFDSGETAQLDAHFKRGDGETFMGCLKMCRPDPSNPSRGVIFIIYDLAWRKQAESEQLQREKLQAVLEITGAVCHDLNQPIQAMLGYTELLMMSIAQDDPLSSDLHGIREQIDRIQTITEKLMSLTKYNRNKEVEKF